MAKEKELRSQLAAFARRVSHSGWVAATDGNLSVRLDAKRILCTPSGMSKGLLKPADMVIVDMAGKAIRGRHPVSSEVQMHLTIYRERPDVLAIVHAHPPTATGFACAGLALDEPICAEVVITLGAVPLAGYGCTGTPALSKSLMPWVKDYDAILLANHGAVAYGKSVLCAYLKMETVEHFAKVMLTAKTLGSPVPLSSDQVRKLVDIRKNYAGNSSHAKMPPGPLKKR